MGLLVDDRVDASLHMRGVDITATLADSRDPPANIHHIKPVTSAVAMSSLKDIEA